MGQGCEEASVASAIETVLPIMIGRGDISGCEEASVASAIETAKATKRYRNCHTLRGSKRRVCD